MCRKAYGWFRPSNCNEAALTLQDQAILNLVDGDQIQKPHKSAEMTSSLVAQVLACTNVDFLQRLDPICVVVVDSSFEACLCMSGSQVAS